MNGRRLLGALLILGGIPALVGAIYFVLNTNRGTPATAVSSGTVDYTGALLLVCLGAAMAFGFFVILRGARDL